MGKTALATNIAFNVARARAQLADANARPRARRSRPRRRRGRLLLARNVGRAARHPHPLRAGRHPLGEDPPRHDRRARSSSGWSRSARRWPPSRSSSTRPAASPSPSSPRAPAGSSASTGSACSIVDYLQLHDGHVQASSDNRVQEVSRDHHRPQGAGQGAERARSSPCRSSRARSRTARTSGRSSPTCVNRAPSSRTPTSSCSCSARSITWSALKPPEGTIEFQDWMAKMQHRQRQGRGDHRQAAPRPDRHRAAAVRRQRHPLLRSGARPVPAGAARSERRATQRAGRRPAPRAPVPLSARAVLTVDLAALRANWARLNQASGRAECAGVIKADAYGLGLAPIAKALTNEGCKTFFVATHRRGPRRARGAARRHHLCARRPAARRRGALRRLRSAPRALEPGRGARLGGLLPRARAQAGGRHPHRHRHQPARHARDARSISWRRRRSCSSAFETTTPHLSERVHYDLLGVVTVTDNRKRQGVRRAPMAVVQLPQGALIALDHALDQTVIRRLKYLFLGHALEVKQVSGFRFQVSGAQLWHLTPDT